MRVVMNVAISGTRDGVEWPGKGAEMVVSDAEGADLCAAGLASPVAEPVKSEKRPAVKRAEKRG